MIVKNDWGVCPSYWKLHKGTETGWRILMPVKGPKGNVRGYLLRNFKGNNTGAKTLTYQQTTEPWVHWAQYTSGVPFHVIVEDIPSAERLAAVNVGAIALMGTHMTDDVESEILEHTAGQMLVVALDRDAVRKGIAIRDRLRMRKSTRVTVGLLEKDVKDMTEEELDLWVKSVS